MTPINNHEPLRIDVPAPAAALILALAQARDVAQIRLDDAANMAMAMAGVPAGWELRAENGSVYFSPATVVPDIGK